MAVKEGKEFKATNLDYWTVTGTDMTLVTDADLPPGRAREHMRLDLSRSERLEVSLVCVHWSDSFQGVSGTHVHGRGWKLHKPTGGGDLWVLAKLASVGDWIEVTLPETA